MADAVPRAFFSYARSDAAFVLRVAQQLRSLGRGVWVDQLDIPKGARWDEAVEAALRASPCLMVVLSPASVKSQNVLDEVAFALDERRPVLPILLQPVAVPFRLKRLQYIDFTGEHDAAFDQLLAALDLVVQPAPQADAPHGAGSPQRAPRDAAVEPATAPSAALQQAPAPQGLMSPLPTPPEPAAPPASPSLPSQPPAAAAAAPAPAPAAPLAAPPATPPATSRVAPAVAPAPKRRLALGWIGGAVVGLVVVASLLLSREPAPHADLPSRPAPPPAAVVEPAAEPAVEPPPAPAHAETAVAETPAPAAPAQAAAPLDDQRIRRFVADYIAALNRADAQALLAFYAERVDYFDAKGVGHDFILQDRQAFHRRWPQIDNRLSGDIAIDRSAGDGSATVNYAVRYRVSSAQRGDSRTGTAHDVLVLRLIEDRPQIVAQRQQVQGDRAAN